MSVVSGSLTNPPLIAPVTTTFHRLPYQHPRSRFDRGAINDTHASVAGFTSRSLNSKANNSITASAPIAGTIQNLAQS